MTATQGWEEVEKNSYKLLMKIFRLQTKAATKKIYTEILD